MIYTQIVYRKMHFQALKMQSKREKRQNKFFGIKMHSDWGLFWCLLGVYRFIWRAKGVIVEGESSSTRCVSKFLIWTYNKRDMAKRLVF